MRLNWPIQPGTLSLPKTLTEVKGQPLLSYILDGLHSIQHDELIVVGGYEFGALQKFIKTRSEKITLAHNPDFKKGNLISLLTARPCLSGSFVITNGDHVFTPRIWQKIIKPVEQITIVCDFDRPLGGDDMKIRLKPDKTLAGMSKNLENNEGGYVGVTLVPEKCSAVYWREANDLLKREGEGIHVESVVHSLAEKGETIEIRDASGDIWFEVDTPEDLRAAEEKIRKMHLKNS